MKRIFSTLFLMTFIGSLIAQPGGGRPGGPGGRPGGPAGRPGGPGGPGGQPREQMMPSSLRLGLIQTLGSIGTNEAEQTLVKVLSTTGSGVEVALIDRQLTRIAEGEHAFTKNVLGAARDLILNPPELSEVPSQLEERAVPELWRLLRTYKDTTFKNDAATLLITDEGLNREALNYFSEVLGADSIPILAKAYREPDLEDRTKDSLYSVINDHFDKHPEAGTILVERFQGYLVKMDEEKAAAAAREAERAAQNAEGGENGNRRGGDFLREMFGGGRGGGSRGSAVREIQRLGEGRPDQDALTARRGILNNLKATTNDEDFQAMFTSVGERLDALANPDAEGFSERYRVSDPASQRREEERRKQMEELRKRFEERRNQQRNNEGAPPASGN